MSGADTPSQVKLPGAAREKSSMFAALRERAVYTSISLVSVAIVIFAYYYVSSSKMLPWYFLPPLEDIWGEFIGMIYEPFAGATLEVHLIITVQRLVISFIIAVALAIPLGFAAGMNKWCQAALYPIVEFIRPISAMAFIPLLIVWFGIGETSKVLALLKAGFFPMFLNIVAGIKNVNKTLVTAAYTLGANQRQVSFEVIFPATVPYIMAGIRIGLGVMWSTIITAELIAAPTGLGHLIFMAREWASTDVVMMGIIIIGMVSIFLDRGIRMLDERLTRWQERPIR